MPERSQRSDVRAGRRTAPPSAKRIVSRSTAAPDDRFFRHIVSSMRNGVIAIRRNGSVALMNDEAYRVFTLTREANHVGRPFTEGLKGRPDGQPGPAGAGRMGTLPNRVQMRLEGIDRVRG